MEIELNLDAETTALLIAVAKIEGRSVQDVLVTAVEQYLERHVPDGIAELT